MGIMHSLPLLLVHVWGYCIVRFVSLQEKADLRKIVVSTNGTLQHYVVMVYWTRPGVGIKQLSDGKQARNSDS